MTRIKICGIRTFAEGFNATRMGAWAIGEVFAPSSRRIEVEAAAEINCRLPEGITRVGVFADEKPETINYVGRYCQLDMVQLHGDEPNEIVFELSLPVIKSFAVIGPLKMAELKQWRIWAYLFDSFKGGSGVAFDWSYLHGVQELGRIILAGGLNSLNVAEGIRKLRPEAVDVSSGVEFPEGGKDPQAMMDFMQIVKEADRDVSR
jgi:phosphoribosylanthranilate isomerase